MKKQLLTLSILLTSLTTFSQEVLYDIDSGVNGITFTPSTNLCSDCTLTTVSNPDANDTEATNVTLWKVPANTDLTGDAVTNKVLNFSFASDSGFLFSDLSTLVITMRFYMPSYEYFDNFDSSNRFRFYLLSEEIDATTGKARETYVQVKPTLDDEGKWYELVFDFSNPNTNKLLTTDVIVGGEIRTIGQEKRFTNLNNDLDYFIDTITSNKAFQTLSIESELFEKTGLKLLSNFVENTLETTKSVKLAKIYNPQGKLLKTYNETTQFNVSDLASGIYLFQVNLDDGTSATLRFVKK